MKTQTPSRTPVAPANVAAGQVTPAGCEGAPGPVPENRIRVLLAEDHPVVRKGIRALLSHRSRIEVMEEARDGQEALRKAKALKPDVLLVDLEMPQANGFTVTETLRKELPQVKTLILSAHPGAQCVPRILQSGARGYVSKEASGEELTQAIELVASGGTYFGEELARLILSHLVEANPNSGGQGPAKLTVREREILTLIAEGLYNKEIGARLHIGTRTVETHRERIMNKLDIHSTAGLTAYAVANGFVVLPQAPKLCQFEA